jgi:hypothetical protein
MVLLKWVVEISARPMPRMFAELGSDSSGIGIMAISGDPIRRDACHRLGRSKECPGGSKVTMLAEHDVNEGAVALLISRAISVFAVCDCAGLPVRQMNFSAPPQPRM